MINTIFFMQLQFMIGVILLLALRPLLTRFPRIISYSLWCLLFLRLLCPFNLSLEQAPWSVPNMVQMAEQRLFASGRLSDMEQQMDAGQASVSGQQMENAGQAGETQDQLLEPNEETGESGRVSKKIADTDPVQGESISNDDMTKEKPRTVSKDYMESAEDTTSAIQERQATLHSILQKKVVRWISRYGSLLLLIWFLGLFFYLAYFLSPFQKFRAYAETAVQCPDREGVYESENASTPYVFGIIRKKIILPCNLSEQEREYIICHEQTHIRRRDYLLKWIVFLLTGIWWFQPFVWIAAYFMEQDMEMSCDEVVIRKMGKEIKKEYARSLLSFAQGRTPALPLTFASGSVKKRIQNVLHATDMKVWMIPIAVVLILTLTIFVFTAQGYSREEKDVQVSETDSLGEAENVPPETTGVKGETQTKETESGNLTLEQQITENFGFFALTDNLQSNYKQFSAKKYQKYRFDKLSKWKGRNGNWKYPAKYKLYWMPSDLNVMASQQFPDALLEEMDTKELYAFIMKAGGEYHFEAFDSYLSGLAGYYAYYNFIHELMNREDCAQVIHQYYSSYSEEDKKKYSKMYRGYSEKEYGQKDFLRKRDAFQLTEAMEWFFLALNGEKVPDERIYHQGLLQEERPQGMQYHEYKADITHDGKVDTVILDTTALTDESKASGEEKTVVVRSGATGKEIASYTANTVHGGWNGIYIYTDDTGDYLVNWQPAMYQGVGNYLLKVFSLNENGTRDVLFRKEFQFDLNPGHFHFNPEAYLKYIDEVNHYLEKSYVIIDTDQGRIEHSIDTKQYGYYDSSETMEEYRDLLVEQEKSEEKLHPDEYYKQQIKIEIDTIDAAVADIKMSIDSDNLSDEKIAEGQERIQKYGDILEEYRTAYESGEYISLRELYMQEHEKISRLHSYFAEKYSG